MAIRQKKRDDLDKLFEELGVLDLPTGVNVDFNDRWTSESATISEDPYAKFLEPQSKPTEKSAE